MRPSCACPSTSSAVIVPRSHPWNHSVPHSLNDCLIASLPAHVVFPIIQAHRSSAESQIVHPSFLVAHATFETAGAIFGAIYSPPLLSQ